MSNPESKEQSVIIHTETATIRNSDNIPYIIPENFKRQFPKDAKIAGGTYGSVFTSKGKFVYKRFELDPTFKELIRELHFYASTIHPCIMRPLYWTVKKNKGYLVMNRGESIYKAYQKKQISLSMIVYLQYLF